MAKEEIKEPVYTVGTEVHEDEDRKKVHQHMNQFIVDSNLMSRDIIDYSIIFNSNTNRYIGSVTFTTEGAVMAYHMAKHQEEMLFQQKLQGRPSPILM